MLLIKKLTDACGLPGFEEEVRDVVKGELIGFADSITVDRMGNLIAVKNEHAEGPHIALSAHMDEVGLCVSNIDKNGNLKFASWGVDQRLLPSMRVLVGKKKLPGVIGISREPQAADNNKSAIDIDRLYIDIGCESKEECEKLVSLGDFAAFDSKFAEFGEGKIKAKALDDRAGCAAVIEMLKSDISCKLTGIFCVQEEIGLRGSSIVSKSLNADLVIHIEGTIGADTEGIPENEHVTTQGAGPALSLMDRTSVYLSKYVNGIAGVAERNNIPYQYRRTGMGGTDAGNYHTGGAGTPCIGISVPCRYIHSPVSVMDKNDYGNLLKLIKCYIKEGCPDGQ